MMGAGPGEGMTALRQGTAMGRGTAGDDRVLNAGGEDDVGGGERRRSGGVHVMEGQGSGVDTVPGAGSMGP